MIALTFWLSFWAALLSHPPVLFMSRTNAEGVSRSPPSAEVINLADWKRDHPPTDRHAA